MELHVSWVLAILLTSRLGLRIRLLAPSTDFRIAR
jgi:hypothetical protein